MRHLFGILLEHLSSARRAVPKRTPTRIRHRVRVIAEGNGILSGFDSFIRRSFNQGGALRNVFVSVHRAAGLVRYSLLSTEYCTSCFISSGSNGRCGMLLDAFCRKRNLHGVVSPMNGPRPIRLRKSGRQVLGLAPSARLFLPLLLGKVFGLLREIRIKCGFHERGVGGMTRRKVKCSSVASRRPKP